MKEPSSVLRFWFEELTPTDWFKKSDRVDELIRTEFGPTHARAASGELFSWRKDAHGRLAEILVLDQFSRNIFRNQARAFASDSMALVLAQEAVSQGLDQALKLQERAFLYMPYMHSESLAIHEIAMKLFHIPGLENNFEFEKRHYEIIQRFGRYPHRNEVLNRISTPEEVEFLKQPGSSF